MSTTVSLHEDGTVTITKNPKLKENFLQVHPDMIHRLMRICGPLGVVKDVEKHLRKFNKEYGDEARLIEDTRARLLRRDRIYAIEFLKAYKDVPLVNQHGFPIRLLYVLKKKPYIMTKQLVGPGYCFSMSVSDIRTFNPVTQPQKAEEV